MRWDIRRAASATSISPVDVDGFDCPSCGSELELRQPDGACAVCEVVVQHGQRSWQIRHVEGGVNPSLTPLFGVGTEQQVTLVDWALDAGKRSLLTRHPKLALADLERRAAEALAAWMAALSDDGTSALEACATPTFVRNTTAQRHRLASAGWTLTIGTPQIDQIEWARVSRDGWGDVADLRVFYTVPWHATNETGSTVDGHEDHPHEGSFFVRLAHPADAAATASQWRVWQLATPQEYAK
jgi:hypothetical protein